MSASNGDRATPRPIHLVFADTNWLGRLRYVEDTIAGPRQANENVGAGWVLAGFLAGLAVGILAAVYVFEGQLPIPFGWSP